ncbi:MAG: hypothetical protein CVU18_10615 [Betaproteobacteria bacterium HGW-Betaproteobacteria-12]|nr:MAG: hypothetical protein CVU18_10615 [Betaproteobacteria bacterium HGW-Betaproteobacteria-12]
MRHLIPVIGLLLAIPSMAQQHDPAMHQQHLAGQSQPGQKASDGRQLVKFPEQMREHTLASMRDHLLALQEIQAALATADFDRAADVAETRLGMTALQAHGAHESSKFMPKGMQDAGSAMHRSASRFSTIAKDAAVTGEIKPAIGALSEVMGACVACHAGYRLH